MDHETPMARLYFNTWNDMKYCVCRLKKTFTYESIGDVSFKVYEMKFLLEEKFLQSEDLHIPNGLNL